jgi:hypothetical protein
MEELTLGALSLEEPVVPRYLRHKADKSKEDGHYDAELERANLALHNRFVRTQRDHLCTHCGRFDWMQIFTHLRRIKSSWDARFQDLKDDIPWHDYVSLPGVSEDVRRLANHPKYQWDISNTQEDCCALCGSLATLYKQSATGIQEHVTISVVLYLESLAHEPIKSTHRCPNVSGFTCSSAAKD